MGEEFGLVTTLTRLGFQQLLNMPQEYTNFKQTMTSHFFDAAMTSPQEIHTALHSKKDISHAFPPFVARTTHIIPRRCSALLCSFLSDSYHHTVYPSPMVLFHHLIRPTTVKLHLLQLPIDRALSQLELYYTEQLLNSAQRCRRQWHSLSLEVKVKAHMFFH